MKLVPGPLPPISTGNNTNMDRLPLPLPFSPDFLWRYPIGFPSMPSLQQPPSSPLMDCCKSQLPSSLASDPRIWSREDVTAFLRWAKQEFDLPKFDMDVFQINGKAMCLLTRADLSERAPGCGDVLHNVLQLLVREANNLQRCLPSSPVTPTSRHSYPLSPHSHPPTPNWNILSQNSSDFPHPHHVQLAAQLMAQNNSVTLSPAPSVESHTGGSPQHPEAQPTIFNHSIFGSSSGGSNGSNSNQSDSEEDFTDKNGHGMSPPNTPSAYSLMNPFAYHFPPRSPKEANPVVKTEFFPTETAEPNTNGRLLWDFLQQLLNDQNQRYTNYIAWKNPDTGVFKIVDPAGLAKLWGIQKNHLSMNYDKMSRALRYYYRVNILRKVQGERHCYQFLRNPTELKNIKNISLLRQQQMSPTRPTPPAAFPTTQQQQQPAAFPTNVSGSSVVSNNNSATPNSTTITVIPAVKLETFETNKSEAAAAKRKPNNEYSDKPTDLSMDAPTDLSCNNRHVSIVCSPDTPDLKDSSVKFFKVEEEK